MFYSVDHVVDDDLTMNSHTNRKNVSYDDYPLSGTRQLNREK